jgi:hypothetical protein
MTLKDTVLFINGTPVQVTNLEISYEGAGWVENEMSVRVEGRWDRNAYIGMDFAQEGTDRSYWVKYIDGNWEYEEVTKKEDCMARDRCDEEKACSDDGYYGGEQLAQQLKDLELTDEQQVLLKYGLVDRGGLITHKGKEVLLNKLLELYGEELVEDLQTLEVAQEAKKAKSKK